MRLDLLREMGELGLLGMLVPEEWGGIGMSTVGFVAAMEQIGLADRSVAAAWQDHLTIGSLPLLLFGDDAQRDRWLDRWPRPGSGPSAAAEPDAGSVARGIRTRPSAEGRRLVDQRPEGVHLQYGHRHVLRRHPTGPYPVGRRRSPPPRPSWSKDTPVHDGVEAAGHRLAGSTPAPLLRRRLGARRAPDRRSRPRARPVPQHARGRPHLHRRPVAQPDPGRARPGHAYAIERGQFGQPIFKFQAIQFKLADIATELEARLAGSPTARPTCAALASRSSRGVHGQAQGQPGGGVGGLRGRADPRGGVGYMLDSPWPATTATRRCSRSASTNEIQHLVIAPLGC